MCSITSALSFVPRPKLAASWGRKSLAVRAGRRVSAPPTSARPRPLRRPRRRLRPPPPRSDADALSHRSPMCSVCVGASGGTAHKPRKHTAQGGRGPSIHHEPASGETSKEPPHAGATLKQRKKYQNITRESEKEEKSAECSTKGAQQARGRACPPPALSPNKSARKRHTLLGPSACLPPSRWRESSAVCGRPQPHARWHRWRASAWAWAAGLGGGWGGGVGGAAAPLRGSHFREIGLNVQLRLLRADLFGHGALPRVEFVCAETTCSSAGSCSSVTGRIEDRPFSLPASFLSWSPPPRSRQRRYPRRSADGVTPPPTPPSPRLLPEALPLTATAARCCWATTSMLSRCFCPSTCRAAYTSTAAPSPRPTLPPWPRHGRVLCALRDAAAAVGAGCLARRRRRLRRR